MKVCEKILFMPAWPLDGICMGLSVSESRLMMGSRITITAKKCGFKVLWLEKGGDYYSLFLNVGSPFGGSN